MKGTESLDGCGAEAGTVGKALVREVKVSGASMSAKGTESLAGGSAEAGEVVL